MNTYRMKVLIAPNTYKEVADSVDASYLFSKYLKAKKELNLIEKPISDGGDAFLNVCRNNYKLKILSYNITKCYSADIMSIKVGYNENNSAIYIESADILGLKVIPKNKRNPGRINSKGLGDLLQKLKEDAECQKIKIDKVFIGIGGTGTNDLALGACSRFGLKIFDDTKELQIEPISYHMVKRIGWSKTELPFKIIPIIDVNNELLGESGATLTFGKQKGANNEELQIIEKGFNNIVDILIKMDIIDNKKKLSGAGGGLAVGLAIFFNAKLKKAKDFIMEDLSFDKLKNNIDYVVTGEGSFDTQSLMDKGCGIVINEFKDSVKRIFLVCGKIDSKVKEKLNTNVYCIELSKYFNSIEESINNFEKGIELACKEILEKIL